MKDFFWNNNRRDIIIRQARESHEYRRHYVEIKDRRNAECRPFCIRNMAKLVSLLEVHWPITVGAELAFHVSGTRYAVRGTRYAVRGTRLCKFTYGKGMRL